MNVSVQESIEICCRSSKQRARNFYYSFFGLPDAKFRAMCVLYAFMRECDDLVDCEDVPTAERRRRLDAWTDNVQAALETGQSQHEILPAVAAIVERYKIPKQYLFDVIAGVGTDLDAPGFATFEELEDYCYHVAGAVGLCCIHIWGFHDDRAFSAAKSCGTAFQLTNILRDLQEDAQSGRLYLPQEDLHRFDYAFEDLLEGVQDNRFHELMAFEVERTKEYYDEAESLFQYIAAEGHPILRAMLRLYRGILDEIERRDFDVFSQPIGLKRWRKMLIAADSVMRHLCRIARLRP